DVFFLSKPANDSLIENAVHRVSVVDKDGRTVISRPLNVGQLDFTEQRTGAGAKQIGNGQLNLIGGLNISQLLSLTITKEYVSSYVDENSSLTNSYEPSLSKDPHIHIQTLSYAIYTNGILNIENGISVSASYILSCTPDWYTGNYYHSKYSEIWEEDNSTGTVKYEPQDNCYFDWRAIPSILRVGVIVTDCVPNYEVVNKTQCPRNFEDDHALLILRRFGPFSASITVIKTEITDYIENYGIDSTILPSPTDEEPVITNILSRYNQDEQILDNDLLFDLRVTVLGWGCNTSLDSKSFCSGNCFWVAKERQMINGNNSKVLRGLFYIQRVGQQCVHQSAQKMDIAFFTIPKEKITAEEKVLAINHKSLSSYIPPRV
ncbi:MAG: hypothetical protein EZS28_041963, partial [Streblomastix strix]